MKRLIGLLALCLLLASCSQPSMPAEPGLIMPDAPVVPVAPSSSSSMSDPDIEARLVDKSWISPAIVQVGNFYPGARAEWSLRLHNGKDTSAEFLVSYRQPDYVKEGYDEASVEAQEWVIITDPTPVLVPKETREILVVLAMPKDATVISRQWEFWISVMEKTGGMIQTEMCSRWLVQMR